MLRSIFALLNSAKFVVSALMVVLFFLEVFGVIDLKAEQSDSRGIEQTLSQNISSSQHVSESDGTFRSGISLTEQQSVQRLVEASALRPVECVFKGLPKADTREECLRQYLMLSAHTHRLRMTAARERVYRELEYMDDLNVPAAIAYSEFVDDMCSMPAKAVAYWRVASGVYESFVSERQEEIRGDIPSTLLEAYSLSCNAGS